MKDIVSRKAFHSSEDAFLKEDSLKKKKMILTLVWNDGPCNPITPYLASSLPDTKSYHCRENSEREVKTSL